MKVAIANAIREHYIKAVRSLFERKLWYDHFQLFQFPCGWEGRLEVVVKVPTMGDEGYTSWNTN